MTQGAKGIGAAGKANTTARTNQQKRNFPTDAALKKIAQEMKISVQELKTRIKVSEVPQNRKSIYGLADNNKMDMKTFCALNGIDHSKWRDYKAKAGETFYIITEPEIKKTAAKQNTQPQVQPKQTPKPAPQSTQTPAKKVKTYTPAGLGQAIYAKSEEYYGAVGKQDFDRLINAINSKNASAIIKAYTKNPENDGKESLIKTITSEYKSDKQARKNAVMHIYDALAQEKGTPAVIREGFKKELDEQFDSWGRVSTKQLDETINRMMASPTELAQKMKNDIHGKWGAVGRESFNELTALVTPKNAEQVIKAYNDLKTGESLIEGITSEVRSSKDERKDAVMHIYNALAKQKNVPTKTKEEFQNELNAQFKSYGMVDTKKLDEIINGIISNNKNIAQTHTAEQTNSSAKISNNKTVVKLTKSGKDITVSDLQRGAISSAKKEAKENFKQYCRSNGIKYNENLLDLAPMERLPEPVVKNGKIVAKESDLLKPTTTPNGKVVVINPGHGGYSSRTGYFDPGSYSFIKKGNGKYAPLLEYDKMKDYGDDLAERLRAQGYAVVITSAHAQTVSDQKSMENIINRLHNGTKGGKKYAKSDIAFISLHADSDPGKSGTGVCFDPQFQNDTRFAKILNNNLNEEEWVKSNVSERKWGSNGIQVLHQTEQNPSVLVEVEYVNGSKSKNLDSREYKNRFNKKLTEGLNEYFGIK